MKESMTITQMIAEVKRLDTTLRELRNNITLVKYYRKDDPFIEGRTVEEFTIKMKEDLQSYIDQQRRLFAIKSALSKANRETTLKVPAQPSIAFILSPLREDTDTEEITIAEAINRKLFFQNILVNESKDLLIKFNSNLKEKDRLNSAVNNDVERNLDKKFPPEMRNAWSVEKRNEEKKKELANAEVVRIDPYDLVTKDAIIRYCNAIMKYLGDIDTLLSQVNASTVIEFEY